MAEAVHIICVNPGISYEKIINGEYLKKVLHGAFYQFVIHLVLATLLFQESPPSLHLNLSSFQPPGNQLNFCQLCYISGLDGPSNLSLVLHI